jgi:hypothetical protein
MPAAFARRETALALNHAVILEMNTDSYRRKAAVNRMQEQAAEKTAPENREDKKPNRRASDN